MQRSEPKTVFSFASVISTLPACCVAVPCANAGTGMSAKMMPSVMLVAIAPAPLANCQTRDSCGSNSGHMQMKLPKISTRHPNQIHPTSGFKYAFEGGADCVCVGMFDFQVREDAVIAKQTLEAIKSRSRPWCA